MKIIIIKKIFAQDKLTEDLYKNIMKANTVTELDDLYAPYKKKKKTRAMIAIEKGVITSYSIHYTKLYDISFVVSLNSVSAMKLLT